MGEIEFKDLLHCVDMINDIDFPECEQDIGKSKQA